MINCVRTKPSNNSEYDIFELNVFLFPSENELNIICLVSNDDKLDILTYVAREYELNVLTLVFAWF